MLKLNINRLLATHYIKTPVGHLMKYRIGRNTTYRLLNNKFSALRISHIERLCYAFKCTPNDLFEWIPPEGEAHVEENPLRELIRKDEESIRSMLAKLSQSELEMISGKIKEMIKKE